jgi:serine protease Do
MQSDRLRLAWLLVLLACPAAASAQSFPDTIDAVAPKVVKIYGAGGLKNLYPYGTGFLVSPQGHIATVWSHILGADSVTVVLNDGRRFEGKVVGAEPPLDLAVLKIEGENLPYFDLSQTATAGVGSRVLAFSNVFKVASGNEAVSVLHGVISSRTTLTARRGVCEAPYSGPVYIVDAITNNPGAGGGVLTTWDGRLLGMLGKELRDSRNNTWVNYVVPIGELSDMIQQISTGQFRSRPKSDEDPEVQLRRYSAIDFGLVMVPDVVVRTPPYVDRVVAGSLAETAGLKSNDLVLFVGETLVPSHRILRDELGRLEAGDRLKLVVRRGNQLVTVELQVPRKGEVE